MVAAFADELRKLEHTLAGEDKQIAGIVEDAIQEHGL